MLSEIKQACKSTGSLGAMFRRLDEMRNTAKEQRQFFSLHLTFREKLKNLGLDSEIINGLSGYNPRTEWSKENMSLIKKSIDKISFVP